MALDKLVDRGGRDNQYRDHSKRDKKSETVSRAGTRRPHQVKP